MPGLHKFYLRQWRWGIVYLILSVTHISQIASLIEGLWYLSQSKELFNCNFNDSNGAIAPTSTKTAPISPSVISSTSDLFSQSPHLAFNQVEAIADAVRQIETLRQDGLISEYEFEQKRRQLLDRIG